MNETFVKLDAYVVTSIADPSLISHSSLTFETQALVAEM